ncbi:OmpP1/FadL family transporter [Rhodanobacter sp. BL-MT-08]
MNRQTSQGFTRFGAKASLALAVVSALSLPLCAQAGSFQLPTTNAAGWGRAGAGGSLFPDDVTAAYNNPAAMAFFDAPMVQVTGTGIRPSSEFQGQFKDQQGNPTTGGNPNGFGKFIPFPDVAWALPVNDRLVIGGSVTVPYGLVSKYNPTWEGRYFGTKTSVQSISASISAGFKVNDEFSIGAGIEGRHTKAQLNTVLDPYGSAAALLGAPLLGAPQSGDVQLNVNVKKNFAFGYFGGFEWKPTQQDSVDMNYHSRIQQTLSGDYKLYGPSASLALLTLAPTVFPTAGLPTLNPNGASASSVFDTPATAGIDWLHKFNDQFSLAASVMWTDWSNFQQLALVSEGQALVALPEKYKDTFSYSIGGDYKLNDQWTLRAGLGYDETPTNIISRDPRIPDGSRRIVGLGVGYQATQRVSFDLGYQHQFVSDVPVNLVNPVAFGAGTMVGKFKDHGDVVSLTGTYAFK